MSQITTAAELTPTQSLVLEVMAARYRLGETLWTFHAFPTTVRALRDLEGAGLVETMSGIVERTVRASLTDAGRERALSATYRIPAEPQRVQPSREDVAERLAKVVAGEGSRNPAAAVDSILALFAAQPTVAEVKAEALNCHRCDEQAERAYRRALAAEAMLAKITPAIRDVAAERATHEQRGWTAEHDAEHGVRHLIELTELHTQSAWSWAAGNPGQSRSHLVKAASLLVAAIELIDREEAQR